MSTTLECLHAFTTHKDCSSNASDCRDDWGDSGLVESSRLWLHWRQSLFSSDKTKFCVLTKLKGIILSHKCSESSIASRTTPQTRKISAVAGQTSNSVNIFGHPRSCKDDPHKTDQCLTFVAFVFAERSAPKSPACTAWGGTWFYWCQVDIAILKIVSNRLTTDRIYCVSTKTPVNYSTKFS